MNHHTHYEPREYIRRVMSGTLLGALLTGLAFLLPDALLAQPISSQDGRPLPEAALRVMRRDPEAYTFRRAYIEKVRRLKENRRLIQEGRLIPKGRPEEIRRLTEVAGTYNVPIFLGKYSDTGADPISQADLQQELFDGPWPTGTMTEYYDEISYGNSQLVGTVYDWVTVSNDDDFYAGTVYGLDPALSNTGAFITEVLQGNDEGVDFGQFDNDGPDNIPNSGDDDGYVDFVGIVHPETGGDCYGAPVDDIWSHRWYLSGWPEGEFTTDDPSASGGFIRVDDYTIMPALSCYGGMIEIGVFCHEFGHAFGLPDLYDTDPDDEDSEGVGHWDLMGTGNWNTPEHPAHMGAWCKAELGWLTPGEVTTDRLNWPILSSAITPTAFKLWSNGDAGDEYFLVEYRTQEGFDDQLEAAGILIWHVDEDVTTNGDETHKWVDLECADQSGADHDANADDLDANTNRGDAGDPFCDGDEFTTESNPSNVAYNGVNTSIEVSNISGCGNQYVRADLVVGQPGRDVNLCMRDCGSDVCDEPSPCDRVWASPEIYIDNNEDGIIDPPAEGIENKLFARVRNVGGDDATDVDVSFYFVDPGMGLLFPGVAELIGTDNPPLIGSGSSEVAGVLWEIPLPPPEIDHYCVGVVATNPEDEQSSEHAREDDNVAQINIQALYAKAGDAVPSSPASLAEGNSTATVLDTVFQATRVVQVYNSTRQTCQFQIRIGSPPKYDDAVIPPDWDVKLEFETVVLAPGQRVPLKVSVRDRRPVHQDFAIIPLTLLCGGKPVGGNILEFHIDNLPPKPSCDFKVVRKLPPATDNNPGEKSVMIAWNDVFYDVRGFPERVERWRIYNGNSPNFKPTAANLLKETCIDEDPRTALYEHFADIPTDTNRTWYKIVAIDRAGNASDTCVAELELVIITGVTEQPEVPKDFSLAQNTPNPFNANTKIRFTLPHEGDVEFTVYSLDGRKVRELLRGRQRAGEQRIVWDGTNEQGHPVASGIYLYRLIYGGMQQSRRMVLLR